MSQSGDVQVPVVPPPPALRVLDGPESSARRVVVKASDVEAEVGRNTDGSRTSQFRGGSSRCDMVIPSY